MRDVGLLFAIAFAKHSLDPALLIHGHDYKIRFIKFYIINSSCE